MLVPQTQANYWYPIPEQRPQTILLSFSPSPISIPLTPSTQTAQFTQQNGNMILTLRNPFYPNAYIRIHIIPINKLTSIIFRSMSKNRINKLRKPAVHIDCVSWNCTLQESNMATMGCDHHGDVVVLKGFLHWYSCHRNS